MATSESWGVIGLHTQYILLLDNKPDQIDQIFNQLEAADLNNVRIVSAYNCDNAQQLMEDYCFALLIVNVDLCTTTECLNKLISFQFPRFVITITETACFKTLLRTGASDVFLASELMATNQDFSDSVAGFLKRAQLMEQSVRYRESLETSLDELRADQEAARQVQQNMLPDRDTFFAGTQFQYSITPSLYLSGDFVDVAPLGDQYCLFYLADVSGHGASSALVTVMLKNIINRQIRNYRRGKSQTVLMPLKLLERLNRELLDAKLGKHLTIFIAIMDSQKQMLTYAVGGHHPMPVLVQNGSSRFLEGRGMPIGLFDEPRFEEHSIELAESYSLTLFSDGILEILPAVGMAEKEATLLDLLARNSLTAEEIKNELIAKAELKDTAIPDDVAIMTVQRPTE